MQDIDPPVLLPRQTSLMPWLLFAVALVAGLGGFVVEKQRADSEAARLEAATRGETRARGEAEEAMAAKRALEQRVSELTSENGRLSVKIAAAESVKVKGPMALAKRASRKHKHKRA